MLSYGNCIAIECVSSSWPLMAHGSLVVTVCDRSKMTDTRRFSLQEQPTAPESTAVQRRPAEPLLQHWAGTASMHPTRIPPHASSTSTTPAMPSTMLHHVDKEFVTPLSGAPERDVRSRRQPARHRLDTGPGSVHGPVHGLERTTKREP